MGSINIRRDVADPFYRYKMEPLVSKIEGKGNGIKSVIVNLSSVAQSLSRNPQYVVKYFGFELGAQVKTNPTDDRWIINGAHEASKLQDHLDGFINKFVLCKECKNPETDLKITKDKSIIRDCKACGQRTPIDMRQRLSGFILKNPPNDPKKGKSSKKSKKNGKGDSDAEADGKDRKEKGSGNNSEEAEEGETEIAAGSDDEFTRKITAEAKNLAEAEAKDDDDWAVDMSEEAVAARAREVAEKLKVTTLNDEEDEAGEENPYEQLGSWIVSEREAGKPIDDVEVYKKAQELGIEAKHKTLQVLAQTLFTEKIVAEIEPRAPFLKKLISSERHEKAFLGGIERFIGLDHPALIKQVPTILMNLYQEDLISEDTLNNWGTRASKKYVDIATSKKVRKAAVPFLTWLAEAQSDDDEDD